jgi:hypothetical protein
MLGPRVTLSYQAAESTDPASGAVRLSGVVVAEGAKRATFETLTLDGLRDDGAA